MSLYFLSIQTVRQRNPAFSSMDLVYVAHYIDPDMYKLTLLLLTIGNYCLQNQAMGIWPTDFTNIAQILVSAYTRHSLASKSGRNYKQHLLRHLTVKEPFRLNIINWAVGILFDTLMINTALSTIVNREQNQIRHHFVFCTWLQSIMLRKDWTSNTQFGKEWSSNCM